MNEITDAERRYFAETAIVLRREGFQVNELENGSLSVALNDQPLCKVSKIAGIRYREENIGTTEAELAKEKVYEIACTTAEYMRQMEQAPPLDVADLKDHYRVLADFNGTVLACAIGRFGAEFITWDWDSDCKGVNHGGYYGSNYSGAKQDFAIRTGLISEQRVFSDEQLTEIYRCCAVTLESANDLTYDQEKCIKGIQQQIEYEMSDIMDRIKQQNQEAMKPYMQQEPAM